MRPIVVVIWRDAQDHAETWADVEDAEKFGEADCTIASVGYLIRKTEKYVTLGGDFDEVDANYGCVRKIPTMTILSIRELEPPT